MPFPKQDETKEEFIARFMESEKATADFPDREQRYAVALSMWEEYQEELEEDEYEMDSYLEEKAEQTFTDYPESASNNAKKVLEWREKYGVDAMTPVGWRRANQLAKREPLSLTTVKRMAQFNRHRKNAEVDPKYKDEPWKDRGYCSWLGWGGTSGIDWAIAKVKSVEGKSMEEKPIGRYDFNMEVKSMYQEGNKGYVNGWANVYNFIDYGNDMIERGAAKKNLSEKGSKRPLNIEHDYANFMGVIGVTEFEEMDYGLYSKNEINLDTELGREVYARAKQFYEHGLPIPFSIGFKIPKGKYEMKNMDGRDVRCIKEIMLDHNSIVMKPMNQMSMATEVKSLANVLNNYEENSYIKVKAIKSLIQEAVKDTSFGKADDEDAALIAEIKSKIESLNQKIKEDVSRIKEHR